MHDYIYFVRIACGLSRFRQPRVSPRAILCRMEMIGISAPLRLSSVRDHVSQGLSVHRRDYVYLRTWTGERWLSRTGDGRSPRPSTP